MWGRNRVRLSGNNIAFRRKRFFRGFFSKKMLRLIGLWISLFFFSCSSLGWLVRIFSLFFFFLYFFLFFFNPMISAHHLRHFFFTDRLSTVLIIMTFWVRALVLIRSQEILLSSQDSKLFLNINITLVFFLWILFSISHIFFFYTVFEIVLVPTIFLIMGWGAQPDRLNASFYFSMYTIFSSLPFLGFLFRFFWESGILLFPFSLGEVRVKLQWGTIFLVRAFLVKLPIYGVHLWLPKAHVEAPVGGSILLAAILLKIGVYGLFRFITLRIESFSWLGSSLISVSLIGGVLVSFLCLSQFDIKSLVAYSSVAHMALALGGVFSGNGVGWRGGFLIAVAHGFASSGFFALVTFIYEGSSRRRILFNKGLLMGYPIFCFFLFINAIANMAAPPTLNLVREIFLYFRITSFSKFLLLILFLIRRIRVGYNLVLYTRISCGKRSIQNNQSLNLNGRQFLVLFLHLVPCFLRAVLIRRFLFF